MRKILPNRLELISFTSGFCLLTYELAAARILAPSIGSSTYVWTSVIGVIIAALALGFWVGGKIADARDHVSDVPILLLATSFAVIMTLLFYPGVLEYITSTRQDVRLQAVYAALLLFALTSFLLGLIGPYLGKLNIHSLGTTGRKIASIDAFNSLGGIVGTFLTGFVLFGFIGSRQTFLAVSFVLLVASWIIVPRRRSMLRMGASAIIVVIGLLTLPNPATAISIDTPSANYRIANYTYTDGTMIRGLSTGPRGIQSAVRLDGSSTPVFWYTSEMARIALEQRPKRILVLGGGAFTLPQFLSDKLPGSSIDVVEIDPELIGISRAYFNFASPSNVHIISKDARTFVNQSTSTYDLILVDVYGDTSIPFSLMTKQYGEAIKNRLAPNGVVVANVIAGFTGPCRQVLDAVDAAYVKGGGFAYSRYATNEGASTLRTNVLLLYSNQPQSFGSVLARPSTQPYGDDYAPAERLYYECSSL